jgi:Ca2+-binding EF-hand superfamily protein
LLDTSNRGYISPAALRMLEHVRGPASLQEADAFRAWLCEWEQQQRRAVLGTGEGTPAGSPTASLWRRLGPRDEDWTFDDFKKAVQKQMKYSAGSKSSAHLLEVFACLDTSSSGFISEAQFMRLNLISANHRLERVCAVRDFLVERFGSVAQAFQALDENRTGTLGMEEFADVMEGQHGYSSKDDIRATFQFVNIHRNHQLVPKDFEVLEELDMFKFFDDVAALEECLVSKHGSLKEAFTAFQEEAGKEGKQKSRATTAMSEHRSMSIAAASARRPLKPDLDPSDFLGGCRLSGFQGGYDPRYVFNFLDPACEGKLGPADFALLGELFNMETLEVTTKRLSAAIDAVRAFALANGDCGEESPWEVLHRRLREATHHDLFA